MKTKRGISLIAVTISIVVLAIITGLVITQTNNVIAEAEKSEFVVELSTIQDKIEERYLLTGLLPVRPNIVYTANELKSKIEDNNERALLDSEIIANNDENNSFLVVDLESMEIETAERGKTNQETDIFVVATNSLNVYYLKGAEINDIVSFSLVMLVERNTVQSNLQKEQEKVKLNNDLVLEKSTNTWTNELKIIVKNKLASNEVIKYVVGYSEEQNNVENNTITLNSVSMTETEKTEFKVNKSLLIRRLLNGNVIQIKEVMIDNLDIETPLLNEMEIVDDGHEKHNIVKISSTDMGGSSIKCIYYDYVSIVRDDIIEPYYTDRNEVTKKDLAAFGKISKDGTITLDKNIKSIIAMAIDNAGNMSEIKAYTIGE